MTLREILLFGHLLAVAVWLGGGVMTQIHVSRAAAAGEPSVLAAAIRGASRSGRLVFMPAGLAVLGFGIALVVQGGWGFEEPWIAVGFAGYLISTLIGMVFLGPRSRRAERLGAERGWESAEVGRIVRGMVQVMRVDVLILALVILDMVVKPG